MVMRLNNIYSVGDYFFIDFSIENKTNIRFDIDEIRVKLVDKKLAKATNAAGLKEGDILTIAGDAQTYVVTEAVSLAVGNTAVKIYPGLARATTGSEAVTVSGSHVMNLAFHRDAIAFATRPLMDSANGLGNLIQSAVDPVSGLSLRLEVSREHKRTRFSYDILYGADVVRRELGCRIAG